MNYDLAERFEPATSHLTAEVKCIWSRDDIGDIVWGFGNTRREARTSALEAAQRRALLHRPAIRNKRNKFSK